MTSKVFVGLLISILSLRMDKGKADPPGIQFNVPGDFVIGGLFAFHSQVEFQFHDGRPETHTCYSFYLPGYQQQLAMRFAIEEINNSTSLLPGVTLGYEIHDTCSDEVVATKLAISFLSEDPSRLAMQCGYDDYKTRVMAVVGPNTSGLSMLVAQVLNFLSIPEISSGSSSIKLSDKQLYPSFFRTIPSDQNQADAMVQLLNYFNWNWVAALVTDNEYGHQVLEVFVQLALSKDMCVAYEAIFPSNPDEIQRKQELLKIANQLEVSRINATVIFSHSSEAEELLQVVAGSGITGKVWIASECWSTSSAIALIPNLNKIGTVLGMAVESGEMPGFQEYVQNVLAATERDLKSPNVPEACPECRHLSLANFSNKFFELFNTYKAVYTIAHGLHQLLNCSTTHKTCDMDREIYPWQLLEEIPKVNFTIESQPVHFSETGDPPAVYDLIFWDWIPPDNHTFAIVGRYDASRHKLSINEAKIRWSTEDGKAPVSRCTQGCKPGQKRWLRGEHNCCFQCEDCPAGYFQDKNKPDECTPCSENQWSTARSTTCHPRVVEYLEITDLLAVIMVALTMLVFAQMVAVTGVFAMHRGSPAMRYVSGFPLQSILFSTTCFCISFPFFVMKPTRVICKVRQPLFFGSFTITLATLLGKTIQSVGLDQILTRPWVRNHLMGLCVASNAALQGLLCLFWYYWEPPVLEENTEIERTILLQCHDSRFPGFGILLAHDYCLTVISFACSLVGYNSEKKDNRAAKSINFAMLLILIIWIIFIPTYSTTQGKFVALFQVFAGLASIFAIFGSYYYPVCYVMLFAPHLNTDNYFCLSQDPPADHKEPSAGEGK